MVRGKSKQIAASNIIHRVIFTPSSRTAVDLEMFFSHNLGVIHQAAYVIFKKFKRVMKMQLVLNVSVKKQDLDEKGVIFSEPYFATKYELVIGSRKIRETILAGFLKIIHLFDNFVQGGSGWTLNKILRLELKLIIVNNSVKCL